MTNVLAARAAYKWYVIQIELIVAEHPYLEQRGWVKPLGACPCLHTLGRNIDAASITLDLAVAIEHTPGTASVEWPDIDRPRRCRAGP